MLHSGSLLAKLIPGACVTPSELPHGVEGSRVQHGFIICCWYNSRDTRPVRAAVQTHIIRGYVQGDGQSNDNSMPVVPTATYWKLQRILQLSNLNGSSAVTSPSLSTLCAPQPPALTTTTTHTHLSSNLFIPTSPLGSQCTQPRTESDAAALFLSCLCVGPLLKQPWLYWKEILWIEISFQSIQ